MTDTARPRNARDGSNDVDLTIRLTEAPGAPEYIFRLEAGDGAPSAASTLPDPAAAVEAVERFGEAHLLSEAGPAETLHAAVRRSADGRRDRLYLRT